MRWLEEDLFNTLKNRGFNIKHDYSRNSSAQIVWSILIMLAFLITELFVITRQITMIKRNRSLRDFIRSIFYELRHLYYEVFKTPILHRKTQFRYCLGKASFPSNRWNVRSNKGGTKIQETQLELMAPAILDGEILKMGGD